MANTVLVRFPSVLRADFGGETELTTQAFTVREIVEQLGVKSPRLRNYILGQDGNLTKPTVILIFVNEADMRSLQNLDTQVKDGDEIFIVPNSNWG